MAPVDQEWMGRTLFVKKGKLTSMLKLWWHPPEVNHHSSLQPDTYHQRRLLLWLPRMMWQVNFHCPRCGVHESLRSKGLYNHVQLVMDLKDYYYVAGEYMECKPVLELSSLGTRVSSISLPLEYVLAFQC